MHEDFRPSVNIYSEAPLSFFGGGERIAAKIGNYLVSKGYKVTYYEPNNSKNVKRISEEEVSKMINFDIDQITFKKAPFFFGQSLPDPSAFDIRAISLVLLRRFPSKSYMRKIASVGSKVVFCLHGTAMEPKIHLNPIVLAHQLVMRNGLSKFASEVKKNHLIYVQFFSETIQSILQRKGVQDDQIFKIKNGVETSHYQPKRNDDCFTVLFAGRIENLSKGIKRLKKTIKMTYKIDKNIQFAVIGTGKDKHLLNNLPPNSSYLGFVTEIERLNAFHNSNLLIVTSNLEPYGIVVVEGLFSGLPVVTSPADGPKNIVEHNGIFGKVSSFRPRTLAETISEYYHLWDEDKKAYFDLKTTISIEAKRSFDEELMTESYHSMIADLWEKGNGV
ncbi:hypothetical protein IX51_03855 [uncultured archaeon]|nr:hypothetical protein IX51_03855 [uncultured archaeon]